MKLMTRRFHSLLKFSTFLSSHMKTLQFSACSNDLDTANTMHRTSFGSAINLNTNSLEQKVRQHPLPCLLQQTTTNAHTPNYNHDNNNEQNNSLDYQNNSSSGSSSTNAAMNGGRQPTFVATIYRRTDSTGIHGNYSYDDAENCAEVNEREMKMSLLLYCCSRLSYLCTYKLLCYMFHEFQFVVCLSLCTKLHHISSHTCSFLLSLFIYVLYWCCFVVVFSTIISQHRIIIIKSILCALN